MKLLLLVILLSILAAGPAVAQEARTYTVKSGDTLHHIARAYGMSVNGLMRMNGLTGSLIRIGQVLRLTSKVSVLPAEALSVDAGHPALAALDQSDSLTATLDVAPSFEVQQNVNRTRPEMARISDELASRIDTTTYTVRAGETLYSIARDLRTKAYILYTLNDGIHGVLEPGTSIVVPAAADGDASEKLQIYAVGTVSVFPENESGRTMAGGSAYDPDDYVVAHPELPLESILIVENPETGRAAFARVADRGPSDSPHLIVVSLALASEIGVDSGSGVQIRLVE
jgi:LysM repeat protein